MHTTNGDLKEGIIEKRHISLSSGNALKAADLLLGMLIDKKAEQFNSALNAWQPVLPIFGTETLAIKLFPSTTLADALHTLADKLLLLWDVFIVSDKLIYSNMHASLKQAIKQEAAERKTADASLATLIAERYTNTRKRYTRYANPRKSKTVY